MNPINLDELSREQLIEMINHLNECIDAISQQNKELADVFNGWANNQNQINERSNAELARIASGSEGGRTVN